SGGAIPSARCWRAGAHRPRVVRRSSPGRVRCTAPWKHARRGLRDRRHPDRRACHLPRLRLRLRRHHGRGAARPTHRGAAGVRAARRRGRAGGTLGELRQRAVLVVFWGVDPGARYPRYCARYAVDAVGLAAPGGRTSRRVIAVDVGEARGPADADGRVAIPPHAEVDALGAMRASVQGRTVGTDAPLEPAIALVREMTTARYVALVADAEPGATPADPDRAEALTALAQALNGPTRCALSMLRGGGNRSGADAVLTWQTGFPFAVDFGRGYPTYRPHAGAAERLAGGEVDAALVIGAPATLPRSVARGLV